MLFQTFLLADFRLMYIIQPAACTAVEKKQMLIDHFCQDFILILNVLFCFGFFFPLANLLFSCVLQNLVLQFCLTVSLELDGKVKSPV